MIEPALLTELAAGVSALWEERESIERGLDDVEAASDARTALFNLALRVQGLRMLGPLVAASAARREELIDAVKTGAEHASWLAEISARMLTSRALLEAMRAVFPGSLNEEDTEAERAYREALRKTPTGPLWGSQERPVSIAELWVPPRFVYRPRAERSAERLHGRPTQIKGDAPPKADGDDAVAKVVELLDASERPLIAVLGAAGAGKSALLTMLAATLSARGDLFPVLVRLRDVEAGRALDGEIERLVAAAGVRSERRDVVLLLDGFDEVPGERIGVSGNAVHQAQGMLRRERVRAVVISGRDVMVDREDEAMPVGTHVLELLPFSREQVARWSEQWRSATGESFDGVSLLASTNEANHLDDVARIPLMLYLLATMTRHGLEVAAGSGIVHTTLIYQRLLRWYCERQEQRAEGKGLKAARLRGLLRLAGFVAMVRGGAIVDLTDLQRAVRASAPGQTEDLARFETEQTLLAFWFRHGDALRWEFSHRSLAEFLAAEFLAVGCRQLTEEYTDEFGEIRYRLSDVQATALWIERASLALIPEKVEKFLLPMLVDPEAILDDRPPRAEADHLPRLRRSLGRVYRALLDEVLLEESVKVSRQWGIPHWRMRGIGLANLVMLAGAEPALLTEWGDGHTEDRFAPEQVVPGRVFEAIDAMNAVETGLVERPRFFGRLGMQWIQSIQPMQASGGHLILTKNMMEISFRGCILEGASLSGFNMAQCDFRDTTLRNVHLDMCNLFHADFRGARFEGVRMTRSDISEARFDAETRGEITVDGVLTRNSVELPPGLTLHETKMFPLWSAPRKRR